MLTWMLIEAPTDSEEIEKAQAIRLCDCVLHRSGSQMWRKVQERPRNRGRWYLFAERALPGAKGSNTVELDLRPVWNASGGRRLRDVDEASARRHQSPVRRRIAVAQHRFRPARENRCAPSPLARQKRMADRVYGFVLAMQPANCKPVLDRACAEAELAELGVRRNGVMTGGKRSDPMVYVVSPSHMRG